MPQHTFTAIKNTNTTVSTIEDFVPFQSRIRISLDPHASHSVVENFIHFEHTQAAIIHKHAAILTAPDLVTSDYGVTASPEKVEII